LAAQELLKSKGRPELSKALGQRALFRRLHRGMAPHEEIPTRSLNINIINKQMMPKNDLQIITVYIFKTNEACLN